jgi:cellulose synthase/poly-beta-1,6-N-acetylglucosamine synthase-like glycosyltransferase
LGKGAVLAWWLQAHAHDWQPDDFIVVLDADSRLSAGSLSALRNAVGQRPIGAPVAQAFVAPYVPENGAAKSGRLAGWSEVLMQQIDDEARRRCHWSVPLRGTGMVFRAELLAELAPRLHTLAEDLELDVLLAACGAQVAFVPEATVFDPKPQQIAGASRQRARWLQGQLQVLCAYHWDCWRAFRTGGPGAVMLLSRLWRLALLGLLLDALYYLAGALLVDDRRRYLRDLLAAPRYVLMWFFSFGMATVRRGWLRAGR